MTWGYIISSYYCWKFVFIWSDKAWWEHMICMNVWQSFIYSAYKLMEQHLKWGTDLTYYKRYVFNSNRRTFLKSVIILCALLIYQFIIAIDVTRGGMMPWNICMGRSCCKGCATVLVQKIGVEIYVLGNGKQLITIFLVTGFRALK